jgi:Protein of unknown function (DUF2490)
MPSYSGGSKEHRGSLEATARYRLTRHFGHVLLSNRNRMDFRVIDGTYSWRYRNRLSTERELSVGPVRVNPYSRFEVFYDSRFGAFSKTELMVGASFPIMKYCELEGYFDHQLDTAHSQSNDTSGRCRRHVLLLATARDRLTTCCDNAPPDPRRSAFQHAYPIFPVTKRGMPVASLLPEFAVTRKFTWRQLHER